MLLMMPLRMYAALEPWLWLADLLQDIGGAHIILFCNLLLYTVMVAYFCLLAVRL
jgi:hypothetical protein